MKRKVLIEGMVTYTILTPEGAAQYDHGKINLAKTYKATVEVKSNQNAGGEAWDWAQKNWPNFVGDEGPDVVIDGEVYKTKVQWLTISGVTSSKGIALPIEGRSYPNYSTPKGCAKIDKEKKKARSSKKIKGGTPLRGVTGTSKAKTKDKPIRKSQLGVEDMDDDMNSFEDYKAMKIQKAMEGDD